MYTLSSIGQNIRISKKKENVFTHHIQMSTVGKKDFNVDFIDL